MRGHTNIKFVYLNDVYIVYNVYVVYVCCICVL